MVKRVYLGWGIGGMVALMIIVSAVLVINGGHEEVKTQDDWTNIAELSDEFLNNYFEEYREMRKGAKPENILMVTSKIRPETYGAVSVVEAPNYLYILQYANSEEKEAALAKLNTDGVLVEENKVSHTMGSEDGFWSWGIEEMSMDWLIDEINLKENLPTVTVAVIDTGMNMEDFEDEFEDKRTILTYCVVECDDGMDDRNDATHGTHVGGIVTEGTSNNVQLMAIKVTNDEEGRMYNSDIIAGINYAASQNVDVINMSLGGPDNDIAMKNALDAAETAGIVNIASAGNDAEDTLNYPASYDSVISVAALQQQCFDTGQGYWMCSGVERWVETEPDASGKIWGSNYGEKIDFAAPGAEVDGINGETLWGTSQASPHIAAAVANLRSLNKNLDHEDVVDILKTYAEDLGDPGWDEYYGWGMPDFYNAPDLCTEEDCDNYGVFQSHWPMTSHGLVSLFRDGTIIYALREDSVTLTSDIPVMLIAVKDDEYTRVPATGTGNIRTFNLEDVDYDSDLYFEYVGDTNLDGDVDVLDLAAVKKSMLLPSSTNYSALSDYQKVVADVSKDGDVDVLDLAAIKKSILLPSSLNYASLNW